jgi:murein DD-endopeptidase MepM/ murein hydrolase activator NlpD
MTQTLVERAWAWLHATFPERQIYIRSEGRVQFFSFGATLQATCAGLSLIFLGWVAFASVNVIFKDRIIVARDHRFQQMQGTYENRIADLQLSYDELNGALISAEDRFKASADELEAKQQVVARLLNQKQIFNAGLRNAGGSAAGHPLPTFVDASLSGPARDGTASDSVDADSPPLHASSGYAVSQAPESAFSGSGASELTIMPQAVEPQPRTGRPMKASFLDGAVTTLADVLFPPDPPQPQIDHADVPALQNLAEETQRVTQLDKSQTRLVAALDHTVSLRVDHLHDVLRRAGVKDDFLQQEGGVGGPLVPVQSARIEGISDPAFTEAYAGTIAHTTQLSALMEALTHVPLTTPVHGNQFEFTSGFGPRVDPFTGRVAFHTGVDFAGPWGSTVAATAAGIVVWAGPRGGYGNMVEIDHGYGFHTRYGHLSSILVREGSRVQQGTAVGRLGSTGRSTGPHVHYEVWLAQTVRDPKTYIDMGRQILQ